MNMRYWCSIALLCCTTAAAAAPPDFSRYQAISRRNIFCPLWHSTQKTTGERDADLKKRIEQSKVEQEKRREELRQQEEQQKLEAKKKQIGSLLCFTGIVFDGQQLVALMQKKNDNKALTLKQGDTVEECRITAIDEGTGSVTLDYQGKFQLILSLNGNN